MPVQRRIYDMTHPSITIAACLSILCCTLAAAASDAERIEASLKTIEQSKLTFIRNDKEYDGKAAAEHLRTKLKRAGDQIKTFDDFVEKVATKSSMSGKPYQVKLEDGSVVELAKWIRVQDAAQSGK